MDDHSEKTRVFDEESGLGVQWVRDEPPMERVRHFRLLLPDGERDFIGYYEYSTGLLMRQTPGLSVSEVIRLTENDWRVEYRAYNIRAEFDREKFVELWARLLANRHPGLRAEVIYGEFTELWSVDGREWRASREGPGYRGDRRA